MIVLIYSLSDIRLYLLTRPVSADPWQERQQQQEQGDGQAGGGDRPGGKDHEAAL